MLSLEKSEYPFKLETIVKSTDHKKILFDLFRKRDEGEKISAKKHQNFKEHCNFVENHPYRYWFLIWSGANYVGSLYVTKNNHIGVYLINSHSSFIKPILSYVVKRFKPLPEIPSVRAKGFHINISLKNELYDGILKEMGAIAYQKTFILDKDLIEETMGKSLIKK